MLHDGPAFDRLCRDVAAARPDPLPMGVTEAEREPFAEFQQLRIGLAHQPSETLLSLEREALRFAESVRRIINERCRVALESEARRA